MGESLHIPDLGDHRQRKQMLDTFVAGQRSVLTGSRYLGAINFT